MMKSTFVVCAALCTSLAFVSCSNEEDYSVWKQGTNRIEVKSNILPMSEQSRVVGNQWSDNDAVGIFLKEHAKALNEAAAMNKNFTVTANGELSPKNDDNALFYLKDKKVDLVAYYPYAATTPDNKVAVDVTAQTPVLYATANDLAESQNQVVLNFKHVLSALHFTVSHDATVPEVKDLKVVIKNVKTAAKLDLATGTIVDAATPKDINATVKGMDVMAYMLPENLSNVTVEVSFNGTKATATISQDMVVGTKVNRALNLSFNNGKPQVTFGNATIAPMTEVEGDAIVIKADKSADTTTPSTEPTTGGEGTQPSTGGGTAEPAPTPGGTTVEQPVGEMSEIFTLDLGTPEKKGKYFPNVDEYNGYGNAGFKFTDPLKSGKYSSVSVRANSKTPYSFFWFAAGKNGAVKIEGFNVAGYKKLQLSYKIAAQGNKKPANTNANKLRVSTNLGDVNGIPNLPLTKDFEEHDVVLDIPAGITYLQFTSEGNADAFRVGKVTLKGSK